MNTQTHLLVACAVLVPGRAGGGSTLWWIGLAAIVGGLAPDASLFVMWGLAKARGVAEALIWQHWYYSDFWQLLGAATNSIPLFLLLGLLGWMGGGRLLTRDSGNSAGAAPQAGLPGWGSRSFAATLLLVFSCAALLHVLSDLPLHHDDGRPHFWPLSGWVFASPVSYWDPAHYGNLWSAVELLAAAALIVLLWRRFPQLSVRLLLIVVALSYVGAMAYWFMAFS